MKLFLASLVLVLSACSQAQQPAPHDIVVSPLARQLAACAIAASDSTYWQPNERIGRYQVNRGAAEQQVVRDNPRLDPEFAAAIVGTLVEDRSTSYTQAFYEGHCV